MRVLICDDMFPAMIETVTRLLPEDEVRVCLQQEAAQRVVWAEVLIPAMTRITAEMIQSAPDLKLIQQFGVGLEGVHMAAATADPFPWPTCLETRRRSMPSVPPKAAFFS